MIRSHFLVLVVTCALTPAAISQDAVVEEYCRRAAAVAPRDANGHFELATWCAEKGLSEKARAAWSRAIEIDPDHAQARAALGYLPQGTGWALRSELGAKKREVATPDASASSGEARATPAAPATSVAATPPDSSADSAATPIAIDHLARKRAWAQEVASKLQLPFHTIEDDDFLIHTTLASARDPRVRLLQKNLADTKKLISSYIGARSSDRLWTSKEQVVLLRSPEQCKQFAELVDGVDRVDDARGGYTANGHLVLFEPESTLTCRALCSAVFESSESTGPRVGWWISIGIAERLEAFLLTTRGSSDREKETFARAYRNAAEAVQSKSDPVSVYTLLESRELKARDRARHEALALTLIDFLQRSRKSSFEDFLTSMRSTDAPSYPPTNDDESLRTYWLNYFAFQEAALSRTFRTDTEKLDAAWKTHVVRESAKLNPSAPDAGDGRTRRGRNGN